MNEYLQRPFIGKSIHGAVSTLNIYTVEPPITNPPTRGQPLYKGHYIAVAWIEKSISKYMYTEATSHKRNFLIPDRGQASCSQLTYSCAQLPLITDKQETAHFMSNMVEVVCNVIANNHTAITSILQKNALYLLEIGSIQTIDTIYISLIWLYIMNETPTKRQPPKREQKLCSQSVLFGGSTVLSLEKCFVQRLITGTLVPISLQASFVTASSPPNTSSAVSPPTPLGAAIASTKE